jgi:hypothetical protein
MKTKLLIVTFFSVVTILSGCTKENLSIYDGTYKGTFTVTYSSGTYSGQTLLEIINSKFYCSGNTGRIPAGGSGTFSLDNNKVTFQDENFWTADFDWNLILNGTYNYTFDGKKLKISAAKNEVGSYKYELVRQ